jgi:hypothetical protein
MKKIELVELNFNSMFNSMSSDIKLEWLGENLKSATVRNGQSYKINSKDDLNAMIEQEMYETLTGKS